MRSFPLPKIAYTLKELSEKMNKNYIFYNKEKLYLKIYLPLLALLAL